MRKLLLLLFLCSMSNLGRTQAGYILYVNSAPSGTCSQGSYERVVIGPGTVYTCQSGTWAQISGGGGGITSIATTAPITGGTITTTGTLACGKCVFSTSPGVGLAHFAGSTQEVTSSAVNLAGADVTGNLPVTNLNSGTSASSSTFWRGDGTWASTGGLTVKYARDNSTISGWTTGGGGTTPSIVQDKGNPTFSLKVPNSSFVHRDLSGAISNFNSASIDFDWIQYSTGSSICNFTVGMDGSGNGGIALRIDGRSNPSTQQMGLGFTTSAWVHTGSLDSTGLAPETVSQMFQQWQHFKITFNSSSTSATWYWEGAAQQANRTVSLAGTNIGVDGDAASAGCEVMNITVAQ